MTIAKRNTLIFFTGGFAAIIPGAFLGLVIGAIIGGTLTPIIDIPEIYAGLRGYEGTGALGLVLGPSLLLLGWIEMRLTGRLRRDARIILALATVGNLVIQHLMWMQPGWCLVLFSPIIVQMLLLVVHHQDEF